MTDNEKWLSELRALAGKATAIMPKLRRHADSDTLDPFIRGLLREAAAFIAASRTSLPELIAENERLQAENTDLVGKVEALEVHAGNVETECMEINSRLKQARGGLLTAVHALQNIRDIPRHDDSYAGTVRRCAEGAITSLASLSGEDLGKED